MVESEDVDRPLRAQSCSDSSSSSFGSFSDHDRDAHPTASPPPTLSQSQQPAASLSPTSVSTTASKLVVVNRSSLSKVAPAPTPVHSTPATPHSPHLKPAAANRLSVVTSPANGHRPRPSVNLPQQPSEAFLSPSSMYTPLFSPHGPKSPPLLRKKHGELALRLGDVMGEIHKHEREKRELHSQLTHRHHPLLQDAQSVERRVSASVGDWKPYDDNKERRSQQLATAAVPRTSSLTADSSGSTADGGTAGNKTVAAYNHPHKRAGSTLPLVVSRSNRHAERIVHWMTDLRYQYVAMVLCLLALYLNDFDYAVLPAAADTPVSAILLTIFLLFSVEIVVQCIVKRNYFASFFFWMDAIGTVSLIFDISFIVDSFWSSTQLTTSDTSSARVQQSASVIRLTRFARILRVIRLVRIVRLFRYNNPLSGSKHPSKVGLHLSELIDKRTILMMLGLVIILPFLTGDPAPDDQSPALGLEVLVDTQRPTDFSALSSVYLATQPDLIYLFINTTAAAMAGNGSQVLLDRRADMSWLRVSELNIYTDGTSQATFSIRDGVYLSSCYSMATTSLIIAVFAIGSYVISRNVHSLVVAPLERMTQIIRKLAGTVCFLSAATEDESRELTDGLETNMIESTIEKMANIFAVQPDGNSALPKPLQMMAGSKHTEILTNSSVVSIEVTERPKGIREQPVVDDGSVSDDRSQWHDIDTTVHRELSTIDEIVSHPLVIPYFDLYLSSCFVSENLHFCLEVDRFRSIIRTHALNLHNSFISHRAHNAINTSSGLRDAIVRGLDEPTVQLFDGAQRECLGLMRGHWNVFLRSRWCRGYVKKAEEQERRRARMQDRKAAGGKSDKKVRGQLAEPLLPTSEVAEVIPVATSSGGSGGGGGVEAGEVTSVEVLHSRPGADDEDDEGKVDEDNTHVTELLALTTARVRSSSNDGSISTARGRAQTVPVTEFPGAVNAGGRLRDE